MPGGAETPSNHTGRGVSPVISVILMVAIVVILGAVIGAFVLGLGEETEEPAPVVTAELDRDEVTGVSGITSGSERIELTHRAGDSIALEETRINTEARCFDEALLSADTKRGELTNLPVSSSNGIQDNNVQGDSIFQRGVGAVEAPLSGTTDRTWESGETLVYHIDASKCDVPDSGIVTVEVIHEPSNSRIVEETLGQGFQPAALEDSLEPATAGDTSAHTLVLDGITYGTSGNSGDQVDTITVDYDTDADFSGLNQDDITVTMTRTLSTGLDRKDISVNNDNYDNSDATFDLSAVPQTDVAGPIVIEIDGIENPSSAGTYDVDITLDGDAGQKTFTKTINIDS